MSAPARAPPKDLQRKWREEEKRQQIELKLSDTEGRGAEELAQEEEVHVQHGAQSVDPDCQAKILKLLSKGSTDEQVSAHVMGASSAFHGKNGAFKFTLARRLECAERACRLKQDEIELIRALVSTLQAITLVNAPDHAAFFDGGIQTQSDRRRCLPSSPLR